MVEGTSKSFPSELPTAAGTCKFWTENEAWELVAGSWNKITYLYFWNFIVGLKGFSIRLMIQFTNKGIHRNGRCDFVIRGIFFAARVLISSQHNFGTLDMFFTSTSIVRSVPPFPEFSAWHLIFLRWTFQIRCFFSCLQLLARNVVVIWKLKIRIFKNLPVLPWNDLKTNSDNMTYQKFQESWCTGGISKIV